jgi:chromate reductase, NAD(P)H dehydrogenase (quinone)
MSNLLILAASNGENLKLAHRFADAAQAMGFSTDVLDLTDLDLPLFTPRRRDAGPPESLLALHAQLQQGERWIICAPEYNGSIPPVLTSAFAWLSVLGDDFRALFNGRPMAMASHSGSGGYEVLTALRIQLAHLGAHVMGRQLIANNTKAAHDSSITAILQGLMALRSPG